MDRLTSHNHVNGQVRVASERELQHWYSHWLQSIILSSQEVKLLPKDDFHLLLCVVVMVMLLNTQNVSALCFRGVVFPLSHTTMSTAIQKGSVRSMHTEKIKTYFMSSLCDFSPEAEGRLINVDNNGSSMHKLFKRHLFYNLKHAQPTMYVSMCTLLDMGRW